MFYHVDSTLLHLTALCIYAFLSVNCKISNYSAFQFYGLASLCSWISLFVLNVGSVLFSLQDLTTWNHVSFTDGFTVNVALHCFTVNVFRFTVVIHISAELIYSKMQQQIFLIYARGNYWQIQASLSQRHWCSKVGNMASRNGKRDEFWDCV